MKAVLGVSLVAGAALFAACSSSSTDPAPTGSSGTSGGSGTSGSSGGTSGASTSGGTSGGGTSGGPDAGFEGGFDFTLTGGGSDLKQTVFQVAPVYGAFCMGAGAGMRTCSFTGNVTVASSGCTFILNVAFVGPLTTRTSFPVVTDPTTPPGKGTVNYTEVCGATTKMWKGTGGTITLDVVTPPAAGLPTGTASFTVQGATMAPAPNGAGGATGSFTISGKGANVSYTPSG